MRQNYRGSETVEDVPKVIRVHVLGPRPLYLHSHCLLDATVAAAGAAVDDGDSADANVDVNV